MDILEMIDHPVDGCVKETEGTYRQVFDKAGKLVSSQFIAGDFCTYRAESSGYMANLHPDDERINFYHPFDTTVIPEPKPRDIFVHSIVKFKDKDGWYRVKSLWKNGTLANLCGVDHGKIYHKQVPLTDLIEDGENQWEHYTKSETYMSQ